MFNNKISVNSMSVAANSMLVSATTVSSKVKCFPVLGMNKVVTQFAKCSPDDLRSGVSGAAIAEKPAAQPVYKPIITTIESSAKTDGTGCASDFDDERKKTMGASGCASVHLVQYSASDTDDERKKKAASFVRRTDTTYNDFVYDDNMYYPDW